MLSIGPGTCRSSGGYSVESLRVHLTFKNSPERNSCGLLILLRRVLFQGSHLLQILLKALAVASWLVRSTSEGALQVRALAGDIVLSSWARHFTLMVLLSTRCINGYH